ncbi:MAG TPA: hypothetical protein VMW09_08555 [Desulfatiglandales bacterium]|nr:hypothetical protein [Desulfatiglandales bacterium]
MHRIGMPNPPEADKYLVREVKLAELIDSKNYIKLLMMRAVGWVIQIALIVFLNRPSYDL